MNSKDINPFDSLEKEDFDTAMKDFEQKRGETGGRSIMTSIGNSSEDKKLRNTETNIQLLIWNLERRMTIMAIELIDTKRRLESLENKSAGMHKNDY